MEQLKVIKRDGREKDFDKDYIAKAILKAVTEVYSANGDKELPFTIANNIELDLMKDGKVKNITVEEIQDLVVKQLQKYDSLVATAYQSYREKRTFSRESNSKTYKDMDGIFNQTSEEVINNANKAGDRLQTYRAMIADVACGNYADVRILPPHILKEHEKSIYVHDKSYLPIPIFNCILVNWQDMLKKGFNMGSTFISSPKSISTAVALLSQILAHTTSNTFGGNTLADLDIGLEPYIQKSYDKHLNNAKKWIQEEDKQKEYAMEMTKTEVYNAVQSLEYEITTLMNSRGEQPFVTITFGRSETEFGRLFQIAYLETRKKGFTDGTTPVFPKICFFLKRGFNLDEGDQNYDIFKLAVSCSAVRMYPKLKIGA